MMAGLSQKSSKVQDYDGPKLGMKQSRTEDIIGSLDKSICELSEAIERLQGKISKSLLPDEPMPVCENEKCDIQRTELEITLLGLTGRIENISTWVTKMTDRCTL